MFDTFLIKQKVSDKYLGQVLHSGGVECSATATVQERTGRIKGATMEIKSIVEEYQMQVSYGKGPSFQASSVGLEPGWGKARKLLIFVTNFKISTGE